VSLPFFKYYIIQFRDKFIQKAAESYKWGTEKFKKFMAVLDGSLRKLYRSFICRIVKPIIRAIKSIIARMYWELKFGIQEAWPIMLNIVAISVVVIVLLLTLIHLLPLTFSIASAITEWVVPILTGIVSLFAGQRYLQRRQELQKSIYRLVRYLEESNWNAFIQDAREIRNLFPNVDPIKYLFYYYGQIAEKHEGFLKTTGYALIYQDAKKSSCPSRANDQCQKANK